MYVCFCHCDNVAKCMMDIFGHFIYVVAVLVALFAYIPSLLMLRASHFFQDRTDAIRTKTSHLMQSPTPNESTTKTREKYLNEWGIEAKCMWNQPLLCQLIFPNQLIEANIKLTLFIPFYLLSYFFFQCIQTSRKKY